jgi:tRNA 2-thiouridine synthesizing protein A
MESGQTLRILATDPGSVRDFQAFSKQTGNALLEHAAADGEFRFLLRKK